MLKDCHHHLEEDTVDVGEGVEDGEDDWGEDWEQEGGLVGIEVGLEEHEELFAELGLGYWGEGAEAQGQKGAGEVVVGVGQLIWVATAGFLADAVQVTDVVRVCQVDWIYVDVF